MRTPVYRNIDTPFEIIGFSALECILICFIFIIGGEVAQAASISRIWSFVLTIVISISLFWFRRALGNLFGRRLLRFAFLPSHLSNRLPTIGRRI